MPPRCHYDRRTFLYRLLAGAFVARAWPALAQTPGDASPAAVRWARLKTSHRFWEMHWEQDATIAKFIRDHAHVPMDPTPAVVTAEDVRTMSQFPLIFANHLAVLADDGSADRAQEYLRRGGFFYVEACVNWDVTPDFGKYFEQHVTFFKSISPGADVRLLEDSSSIFRSYFKLAEADTRTGRGDRGHWGSLPEGLYGVFQGQRMISLLSLDHLCCGWLQDRQRAEACVEEIANIYVLAMTR